MVWKEIKEQQKTERVEKSGKVFNAEQTFERFDILKKKENKNFGQVDLTDNQLEEAEERDRKQNATVWKSTTRKIR